MWMWLLWCRCPWVRLRLTFDLVVVCLRCRLIGLLTPMRRVFGLRVRTTAVPCLIRMLLCLVIVLPIEWTPPRVSLQLAWDLTV